MTEPVEISVRTRERAEAIDITSAIEEKLSLLNTDKAINIWVPHTTAAVTVNEAADPAVMSDLLAQFDEIAPWSNNYTHMEGNSAAHVKSMLLNCHQWLPVDAGCLQLGRWQGVFFMEFDGPRRRTVYLYPD